MLKKMLQDEDYKIRNAIDRLNNLSMSPSVGSKVTSWWQGLSTAFTTSARRTALQINTVIDKAFTPEPSPETVMPWPSPAPVTLESEITTPVQKAMDEKPYIDSVPVSVASPKLERQESFIVEPPTCDCTCDVPSAECEAPSAECEAPSAEYLATDTDTDTATDTDVANASEPTLGTDSAIWSPSGHGRVSGVWKALEAEDAEAEKKEL